MVNKELFKTFTEVP